MTENAFTPGEGVPAELTAGDAWLWRADDYATAYPPADYGLDFVLTPEAGGAAITAAAAADSGGWLVTVPAATTAAATPGRWRWSARATRASDGAAITIARGDFEVCPDPAAAADMRSPARRLLDAIEAVLEGRITKDVESYTIEGRSLTRVPLDVLRATRARLMREVAAEDAARAGRAATRVRKLQF